TRKFSLLRLPMGWSFSSVTLTCNSVRSTFTLSLKLLLSCANRREATSRYIRETAFIFIRARSRAHCSNWTPQRNLFFGTPLLFSSARKVPNWRYYERDRARHRGPLVCHRVGY